MEIKTFGLYGIFGRASLSQDESDAFVPVGTEDNKDDEDDEDDEDEYIEDDEDSKVDEDNEDEGDDGRFWRY